MSWTKRGVLFVVGVVLAAAAYAGFRFGPVLWDLARAGFFDKDERLRYHGTSIDNLKALYTAMSIYHESEGGFPPADVWMDRIENRIHIANMSKKDALKKFVNPLLPPAEGTYGYAMNDAAGSQYKGDILAPDSTPLLFDSSDTSRNAHGDPKTLLPNPARPGGNLGVSVEGSILKL